MILYGDYHTHTKYSRKKHGKGSILENASVALNKGLSKLQLQTMVLITDVLACAEKTSQK